jgi:hypothetical protein
MTAPAAASRPGRPAPRWRRAAPFALLLLFAFAAAIYLRYGLIQSTPIGLSCLDVLSGDLAAPWYCAPREALVRFNMMAGWSVAALVGGGLALLTRHCLAIALGLLAGAMGLVLYNAGPAAGGLVMALFALLRR